MSELRKLNKQAKELNETIELFEKVNPDNYKPCKDFVVLSEKEDASCKKCGELLTKEESQRSDTCSVCENWEEQEELYEEEDYDF